MNIQLFLIVLLTSTTFQLCGQDTIYYDIKQNVVENSSEATYYKLLEEKEFADSDRTLEKIYLTSGQIISFRSYIDYKNNMLHGKSKEWYPNGELKLVAFYNNNSLDGTFKYYWENGQLKYEEEYDNGILISGEKYDNEGKGDEHEEAYLIMPEFPGGDDALIFYLKRNIKYPKKSYKQGVEGRVVLTFLVNKDGSISDLKVAESVNEEIDTEALRVVSEMPKFIPGRQNGENIEVQFAIPINFQRSEFFEEEE